MDGMWHGCMLRAPVFKSVLDHLDTTALDGRNDVAVVRTPLGVGVIARDRVEREGTGRSGGDLEDPGRALGRRPLPVPAHASRGRGRGLGWAAPPRRGGPRRRALAAAAVRVDASYTTAFVAPAAIETRVAVAVWDYDRRLTIWTGTQTPFLVRAQVAAALELDEEDVRVIVPPTGGGFGGKHGGDVATEAAMLARGSASRSGSPGPVAKSSAPGPCVRRRSSTSGRSHQRRRAVCLDLHQHQFGQCGDHRPLPCEQPADRLPTRR